MGFIDDRRVPPYGERTIADLSRSLFAALGVIVLLLAPVVGVRMSIAQITMLIGLMLLLAAVMTSLGIVITVRQRTMDGSNRAAGIA